MFVRARLDEREALYRKIVQPPLDPPGGPHESWAMRDIAAKRAIVDTYVFAEQKYDRTLRTFDQGAVDAREDDVRHLAAIDDSHPDYDESWRP